MERQKQNKKNPNIKSMLSLVKAVKSCFFVVCLGQNPPFNFKLSEKKQIVLLLGLFKIIYISFKSKRFDF